MCHVWKADSRANRSVHEAESLPYTIGSTAKRLPRHLISALPSPKDSE